MINIGSAITTITFENSSNGALVNEPITFGQIFKEGDLPSSGAAVILRAPDNSTVPCQINVKNAHSDGSVKHAILSAIIPALAASITVVYSIVRAATGPIGSALTPADFPGLNATVLLSDNGVDVVGPQVGTAYTADAAALLAAGTYQTWLSGPIAIEWIVRAPLKTAGGVEHPDLGVRFSIRAFAGQSRAKVDFVVENCWAKEKAVPSGTSPWDNVSSTVKIYSYSLKIADTVVDARAKKGYTITRLTFTGAGVYDNNSTGIPNTDTVYTATITVNGTAYPISMVGSSVQKYGLLRAAFDAQLGGAATCVPDSNYLGLVFQSATAGANTSVVISYGTLFPAMTHPVPYRPIRGDEFIHYPGTYWKKTFYQGAQPAINIAHDKEYLVATKAIPNYRPDLVGSVSKIAESATLLALFDDIGRSGVSKASMGAPGYASGIGILPEWAAMYFVSQNSEAKRVMLKQADLQGSWPAHARDWNTDQPINFEDWPYAVLSNAGNDSNNPATGLNEVLPVKTVPACIPNSSNVPDISHHPDFCFLPYLVTGDYHYLEGLIYYQRFLGLGSNPHADWRGGRKCLWKRDQTRGQGWALRTTAHALYIIPDDHPLKADVLYNMTENANWYLANYVSPGATYPNAFGFVTNGYSIVYTTTGGGANTGIAPWMDDYITQSCGRAIELGFSAWLPFMAYKSKNVVGRLTSGAESCWQLATAYTLRIKASASSPLYTTWGEVYQATHNDAIRAATCGSAAMATALSSFVGYAIPQNAMPGYPSLISGYPASMQPAVAYAASLNITGGADAWTVFDARAAQPDYNLGPQFGIVPRADVSDTPVELPDDPINPVDPVPETPQLLNQTMTIKSRIKDGTATVGTGSFALAGDPPINFRAFSVIGIGVPFPYSVHHTTLNEWEEGWGQLDSNLVLQRTTVTDSSNGGQKVPFSAGAKEIFCDLHAAYVDSILAQDGASAYELAVNDGFIGTLSEWIDSLEGTPGPAGQDGQDGADGSGGSGSVSGTISYNAAVPLTSGSVRYMPQQNVTGAIAFTAAASPVQNSSVYVRLVGNGTNTPTFTGMVEMGGSAGFDARNGVVNLVLFFYDGVDVWYFITQKVGAVAVDNVAPTALSAVVDNATPTLIVITMSEVLNMADSPATSTISVPGHTVSSVTPQTGTLRIIVSPAITGSETVTVSYTPNGTNNLRDPSNNAMAAFSALAVTNNVIAADTTGPVLSAPTGVQTGTATATVGATTNEANGTMKAVATTSATPPSASTIKASSFSLAITTTGAKTISVTGLTANTLYYAHTIQTDAAGNDSNIVTSASFTTAASATAPAQMAAPVATAGDTTASVVMVAPATGGSAITGYTVTSSPAGGVDSNAGGTGLTHAITGLTNGTAYTFTATATNAIGTSAASPASNSVTPAVAGSYPRFVNQIGLTESGTGPYTYLGTNAGDYTTQQACCNKALGAAGVDGSLSMRFENVSGNAFALGLQTVATNQPFSSLAVYMNIVSGVYSTTVSAGGTNAGAAMAPAENDILRVRAAGTAVYMEVARAATPTTFVLIGSWPNINRVNKYIGLVVSSDAKFTLLDAVGLV